MFWLGFGIGAMIGANVGLIVMALFKTEKR